MLGPNVPLAPDTDPGDGFLDVVLLRAKDRVRLADYVEARLRGDAALDGLETHRGRSVRLVPPAGGLHVDDKIREPKDPGRVVELSLKSAVEVVVPRSLAR